MKKYNLRTNMPSKEKQLFSFVAKTTAASRKNILNVMNFNYFITNNRLKTI